jgi:hypothetical protein
MARAKRHAIPEDVKKQAEERVDAFNTRVLRAPHRYYRPRYWGLYVYLDRVEAGSPKFICRLTYTGQMDNWEFAIYKYSDERYDPDEWMFPGAGHIDGTIEGAMKAGLEAYP